MIVVSIFVIIYLSMVLKMTSKRLTKCENFHYGMTIPTFLVALCIAPLQLINSNPQCHNIHNVVKLFEVEYTEWSTIFYVGLKHIHTPHQLF